ncbi:iron-sulfur cluster repair di-iron protein [Aridibaculum aurantiacum]|uniref:iron-sulfur cluster repair di-iron protein n=1 Tax=Aridibaculum aurantiacum TaxID=2810307 RepID=UPI001A95CBCA|nr:iron-sulfur cluster repair di-iron protein [Aridibaculum aurantiacum]
MQTTTIETAPVSTEELNKSHGARLLNVTLLEPRLKHSTIFNWFDELQPGEAFCILNDHDPKPLYYQMIAERGNVFGWQYLQKGPVWWEVQIKKNDADQGPTVGAIAASDMRKAEVFKKYGIDFCCGGKKSLKQACAEKNLDTEIVERELQVVASQQNQPVFDFSRWDADFLVDYIYNQHHTYYYKEGPVISDLLHKVATRHGNHHPELLLLAELYQTLEHELAAHFTKEERVLFPMIKHMVHVRNTGGELPVELQQVETPVQMMEADHEGAGEILKQMRQITNDFTPPANACSSFGLLYFKLGALEADLHQHIHLENNILFPKAVELEKQLLNKQ